MVVNTDPTTPNNTDGGMGRLRAPRSRRKRRERSNHWRRGRKDRGVERGVNRGNWMPIQDLEGYKRTTLCSFKKS